MRQPSAQGYREPNLKPDRTRDLPQGSRDDAKPGIEPGEAGATIAQELTRLRGELAQREQLGAVMASVIAAITSSGDQREIMTRVVALAGEAIRADAAYVALLRDGVLKPAYLWRMPGGFAGTDIAIGTRPFAALAGRGVRPVAIDDCQVHGALDPELQRRWGVRALLIAPMVVRGELLGGLCFHYTRGEHRFTPSEIAFAQSVAGATSQALQATRLFEEQRRIAVTLQENFVHPVPELWGLELSVVAKPAAQPELVGGDFSDVFLLDGGHVAVLVGDVAGKGIRAAGLTETVRSTVRAFAAVDPSPAFVLQMTNRLLLRREVGEDLVTALLVVLDPLSGRARFASAAHPPAVQLSASSCRLTEVAFGLPLGAFDEDYRESELQLIGDDALVLYTDGVTEARRGGELFGYERLVEAVAELRGTTTEELAEGVNAAAVDFAGGLKDDLLVVALRRTGGTSTG